MKYKNVNILCIFLYAVSLLFTFSAVTGCGGSGTNGTFSRGGDTYPDEASTTKPASISQDQFRPNYAGDLTAMYYYPQETITYRILGSTGATAINMVGITSQDATPVQAQDIRDGFSKIETALEGRRHFVEVAATDTTALIDVVVQNQDSFGTVGEGGVAIGRTDLWYPGGKYSPVLGRSVVRLMADQPVRSFRRTALHEEIHAVGLWGHSRHTGDILVPVSLPLIPNIELSKYDINTLQANYTR